MGNKGRETAPSGLILLHKQPGITSFDSLRDIKRILGTGKAGHTGTLDKFAEGLLLVLTGRALKLSRWFTGCDKQYEGTVCFGVETETLDPEGAPVANAPLPSREAVESALSLFCGEIQQAPPAYSAIHIDGERASVLARRGEIPEMQKRPVTIHRLELLSWEPPYARIFVHCSSGTYIRSLARDIALAAGSRAHLTALVRTKVGKFEIGEVENGQQPLLPTPYSLLPILHPINRTVFEKIGLSCIEISPEDAKNAVHGKPLAQILKNSPALTGELGNAAALFSGDNLIAVIEKTKNEYCNNLLTTPHSLLPNIWNYGYVYARD